MNIPRYLKSALCGVLLAGGAACGTLDQSKRSDQPDVPGLGLIVEGVGDHEICVEPPQTAPRTPRAEPYGIIVGDKYHVYPNEIYVTDYIQTGIHRKIRKGVKIRVRNVTREQLENANDFIGIRSEDITIMR